MERADYLTQAQLQEMAAQIDPNLQIEPEAEQALQDAADEFVANVTAFACELVQHRGGKALEARDVALALEKNWNTRLPGVGDAATQAELKSVKRPAPRVEAHQQRLQMVRRSQAR